MSKGKNKKKNGKKSFHLRIDNLQFIEDEEELKELCREWKDLRRSDLTHKPFENIINDLGLEFELTVRDKMNEKDIIKEFEELMKDFNQ